MTSISIPRHRQHGHVFGARGDTGRVKLNYERFAHLVPHAGHKDSIIESFNTTQLAKKVIIWSERSKHFYVFNNVTDLEKFIAVEPDQHYYEVVFGWKKQRPKFDIDSGDEKTFAAFIEALQTVIGPSGKYIVTDSSSETKFSRHVIVDKYVANVEAAKKLMEKVVALVGDENIDTSVYKSIQYFRLLGSSKLGKKTKRIIYPRPVSAIINPLSKTLIGYYPI